MENTSLEILKNFWGYDRFRPLQEDIISAVRSGKDTLALLPTGGGKSICFQVPGLALGGLTLVISPLIALMKDQVANLKARGIPAAEINSSLGYQEIDRRLQAAMEGEYRFLYIAPERIATDMFIERLPQMDVRLLAVDEAHCISQWGFDFRPAYLEIHKIREILPDLPIVALTATATRRVRKDILEQLQLREPEVFVKSFRRENLVYEVEDTDNVLGRIVARLKQMEGSGIVYARTRKMTIRLAHALQEQGISAEAYHGGLPNDRRSAVQQQWIDNEIRVITATNAFGMGIDKPDVRFVMHFHLPLDLESYYQEAGRAGRDGEKAWAVAFVNNKERDELERWATQKYPPFEAVQKHYESLCNNFGIANTGLNERHFPFDVLEVSKKFNHSPLLFFNSLRLLDNEGLILLNDRPEVYGWIKFGVSPQEVVRYKERTPEMESLIDFMLRTLGGDVYWEEIRFLPDRWAGKLKLQPSEIREKLNFLARQGIINYRAPVDLPTVKFLSPRHRLTRQELNWEKYDFLKRQQFLRLTALLQFAQEPGTRCRSRMLEDYFGEQTTSDCGMCDYCRSQNAPSFSRVATDIFHQIKTLLQQQPLSFANLSSKIEETHPGSADKAIRHLMDEGKIVRRDDFMLVWKR